MKNKGFTLVELLGVIVVLAIIAIIAVPTILGIIEKSRKGSLQNSGYGLVEAGTLYNAQYQNEQTARFDIKDNEMTTDEENKLTYKGDIKEGTVLVNNNGEVTVCINDGKYAAYKNFKDNKVIVVEGRTCNIPENSNIVYLDNEATIDINIEELVSKINQLEQEVKLLKEEKANQTEITNQITNLNNTHNTDVTLLNNKLGNVSITNIGNGTITGAINDFASVKGTDGQVTSRLEGTISRNTISKTGLVANIVFQQSLNNIVIGSDPFATLPEGYRPIFDCYLMGTVHRDNTIIPTLFLLKATGEIRQLHSMVSAYQQIEFAGTYPIQP